MLHQSQMSACCLNYWLYTCKYRSNLMLILKYTYFETFTQVIFVRVTFTFTKVMFLHNICTFLVSIFHSTDSKIAHHLASGSEGGMIWVSNRHLSNHVDRISKWEKQDVHTSITSSSPSESSGEQGAVEAAVGSRWFGVDMSVADAPVGAGASVWLRALQTLQIKGITVATQLGLIVAPSHANMLKQAARKLREPCEPKQAHREGRGVLRSTAWDLY